MSEDEDIHALAGEYVLGTLDAAERASVAARRRREPELDAAIEAWERLLAPLEEAAGDVTPPIGLFSRIESEIDARSREGGSSTTIVDLTRRLRRWRASAYVSGAVAAGLAIFLLVQNVLREAQPANFVAVLQKDAASPAFLVEVDLRSRLLTVRPVAAERQAGKSYELWLIHAKLGAPRSLGVIADQGFTVRPVLTRFDDAVVEDGTYAVTLEPEGGSPTGAPTSAPLWTGKLVQATP